MQTDEQITREALLEYADARGGFHPSGVLAGVVAYVATRYAGQSVEWRARKILDVEARVLRALVLAEERSHA